MRIRKQIRAATLRANRWTDLHEIFREGVGRPDYIFGQFRETARCATRGRGLLCFRTTACYH